MLIDIAEVARRSGVAASTLRYYEEKGLIRSIGRHGLRRVFNASVLDQLALIALGRVAGFTLDEIATMFAPDGQPDIDRAQLSAQADQIDATVRCAACRPCATACAMRPSAQRRATWNARRFAG